MPKRLLTDYLHEYAQITDLFTGLNEMIRQSAYYQQLPDLIVGCDDLDGVADQLPIIFEEIYVSDSEYNESCKMSLASFRSDSNIRTRRQYERKTSHSSNEFSSSSSNPADSKLQKRLRKKALNTGDSVHAYSNSNKSIQLVSYKKKDEYSTDSVFSSEPDLASQSNHQEKLSKIRAELDTKQPASNLSSTKTQLSTVCSLFQDNKCVDTNSVNANIASASDLLFGTDKQDVTLALDSIELSEIDSSFTSLSDNSNVVCTPQSIKNGPSDASYKSKALYESFRGKISTLERPKMYGNMRKSLLNHSYSLDEQKSRKNSAQSNSSDPVRLSVNRECLTMEDECTPVPPVRHKKLLNRQLSLEQNHNILEKNSLSNFMSPSLVKFVQQREDLRKMLNQKYPLSNIYSQFSSNFCAWPYFYAELMPPLPLPIARPMTALSIRRNSTRGSFMSTLTSKSKLLNKMLGTSIDTIGQQDNSSEFEYDEDDQQHQDEKVHLVVCVHGLDGNSGDLRLVRTYLELALPGAKMDFLMSEQNQENTFDDIEIMTEQLIKEIQLHLDNYGIDPDRISFIGHSLGNLIIRSTVSHEKFKPYVNKLYTYLSLSGPHLGTLYNSSGLINMGLWLMQKWKKSGSLLQLSLKDNADLYKTFLYKLSRKKTFEHFKNVLLVASPQDRYVPFHSARVDMCKSAFKDSVYGTIYREMVTNMLKPIRDNPAINFRRYSAFYSLPNGTSNLIGRAAHVAVLDSEFFVEKLVLVSVAKYFR